MQKKKKDIKAALRSVIRREVEKCMGRDGSTLSSERADLKRMYLGYGYETDEDRRERGLSTYVDRSVLEVVEWAKPGLLRAFCGSDEVIRYDPKTAEQEQSALDATLYVNQVVFGRNMFQLVDTVFTDEGAGTVQLEGEIATLSVVVENSTGHDYTFTGSGKLTGATSLTKTGTGELSLATANEHTGGTVVDGGTLRVQHSTALGAADATVTTAAGTLLSVENNAAVVLASATGNSLAGRVQVQTGASLEVQGTGYHAEATQLEGELIFSGAGVNHTGEGAGTLSGSGQLKVQGSGSSAQFSSAADYTGHVSLADGAEFAADKLVMKADTTLAAVAAGTSLGLEDIVQPGTAQVEMHTTRFDSYAGTLNTDVAANCYSAGTLALVDGLTLEGGSTYQADGSSLNLNGGSLTLNSGSGSDMFVNLMLSLDGAYTPEVTQIVLFTGVAEFCLGGQVFSTGDTPHVFAAADYLTGDYVFETTALVYDGNVGCVYMVEAMPEPTTTTLSLLALAGLCARRRRND